MNYEFYEIKLLVLYDAAKKFGPEKREWERERVWAGDTYTYQRAVECIQSVSMSIRMQYHSDFRIDNCSMNDFCN